MSATDHSHPAQRSATVTPQRAVIALALYATIFLVIQVVSGVDYDKLSESTSNLMGFVVIPVGLGVLVVGALTIKWGALTEILNEPERLRTPKFLALLPVLMVLYGVLALVTTPWDDWTGTLIALILFGTILVGIGEELVFRGWVLVGARQRFSEVGAWFVSSAAFASFHGLNIVTGQSVGTTIQQIVFAFVVGTSFYLVRRWSGTLLLPMALHALWDCSTFLHQGRGGDDVGVATEAAAPMVVMPFLMLLTFLGIFLVLRRHAGAPSTAGHA